MSSGSVTVEWDEDALFPEQAAEMTGLEFIRGWGDGTLTSPPIAKLFNMEGVEAEEGRLVIAATPAMHHYNLIGGIHAAFAMVLVDSAGGGAVHTTLPAGTRYTTLETKVNFVRAITPSIGRVLCDARVLHRGRRVATAEARVVGESDGKLYAHGLTTCLVLPPGG